MDKQLAVDLVKKLTSYTKHYAVVNISGQSQGVTRFANSEISQNVNKSDLQISLTLHDGKKEATSSTNVLDNASLKKLVQDTETMLAVSPAGEFDAAEWNPPNIKDTENDSTLAEIYNAKGRAEAIKEGVAALDGLSSAGALILQKRIAAYGNSSKPEATLFSEFDNVQFNTVVTHNGADGGGESVSHKASNLNIPGAFSQAKQRALMGANPITLDGGTYTVVLTPEALGDLMFFLTWSLNAKRIADGASFYCGLTGTQYFGKNINIYDDVSDARTFPIYFDYEGNKRKSMPLIESGEVKNILYCNKTAAKVGVQSSGHALTNKGMGGYASNLVMQGGSNSLDEMIKSTERGLFISEFHYTNFVNPKNALVTGLTRNGTFLIENGKLGKAVNTMRFTQSLLEAFSKVTHLSKDLSIVGSSVMPSAKIEGFTFP